MSRSNPQIRNFAERLVLYEIRENESLGKKAPIDFEDCEKLRSQLTTLMGAGGFRALLARALELASAEVPWLREVNVQADGSLEGWNELAARVDPQEITEGSIVLVAQLLGLLVAFVGDDLTQRLVGEAWPRLSLHESDFGKGDNHEKAK